VLLFDENHDFSPNLNKHIATALPPLPKNPEVKSTSFYSVNFGKLIDLYRAHGLRVCCKIEGEGHVNGLRQKYDDCGFYELDGYRQNRTFHFRETECNSGDWGYIIRRITHAIDEQGNRIEIAIKD
jgi:hypothetical protein